MSFSHRQLGHLRPRNLALNLLYSPSNGREATVQEIWICNSSNQIQRFSLYYSLNDNNFNLSESLYQNININPNSTIQIRCFMPLAEQASLGVQVSEANTITFQCFGSEYNRRDILPAKHRCLAQVRPDRVLPFEAFIPTNNSQVIIKNIFVTNLDIANNSTFKMWLNPRANGALSDYLLYNNHVVAKRSTLHLPVHLSLDNEAGRLLIQSNQANNLIFHFFGIEQEN